MTNVMISPIKYNCEDKLGKYMDESDYDLLVEDDLDFYAPIQEIGREEPNEAECIFKFRKNRFTVEEQLGAYTGLVGAAQPTQNRGLAAGPKGERQGGRNWCTEEQVEIMEHLIKGHKSSLFDEGDPIEAIRNKHKAIVDPSEARGIVWIKSKIEQEGHDYETFFETKIASILSLPLVNRPEAAKDLFENYVSNTTYANQVLSGIAGFFDRYPRIPWGRATSYTENHRDVYEKCYPFMRKLSSEFQRLLPERYGVQYEAAAQLDPRFRVAGEDTPFTTVTVNKNFRTSAHRDAGDLHAGFSNLSVIAKDKEWEGGYLVLPEYRVAINIRPGDLLLINNHDGIHGNTELVPPKGKTLEDMERISLVCYFREKMLQLGSWEYEALRRRFVAERSKDTDHANYRPLWNGVSANMWQTEEWYDYIRDRGQEKMLNDYHPEALNETSSLESFFA
tara:strand:- start:5484 stop:6830 length:1347 start_codon:yes stop_codon:yes gene_type:complete